MSSPGRQAGGRGRTLATEASGVVACLSIMRMNALLASVSASGGTNSCRGGRIKTKGSRGGGGIPFNVLVSFVFYIGTSYLFDVPFWLQGLSILACLRFWF